MKRLLVLPGVGVLALLVWYLFFKADDYRVTFTVATNPGTVYQSLKTWDLSQENAQITSQQGILNLTQVFHFSDSTHIYTWDIKAINDSLTRVRVFASDPGHSLMNKINIPFSDTDFEKRTRKTLTDFDEKLREHIRNFRVKLMGPAMMKSTYCACVQVKTSQYGKANGMMQNFGLLSSVLVENEVQLNGRPFLEVTRWDMETDSIDFNFCYPIIKQAQLPQNPDLFYKDFESRPAVKAEYNGNYITSDRAWYLLLDYGRKEEINVTGLPVEVFQNNPNMGGNELNWKAEIYMPLIPEDE